MDEHCYPQVFYSQMHSIGLQKPHAFSFVALSYFVLDHCNSILAYYMISGYGSSVVVRTVVII